MPQIVFEVVKQVPMPVEQYCEKQVPVSETHYSEKVFVVPTTLRIEEPVEVPQVDSALQELVVRNAPSQRETFLNYFCMHPIPPSDHRAHP